MHAPTDIHGESGLDGTDLLPKPQSSADRSISAVEAMAKALRATEPGTAFLVATGALTNVAALFSKYPELAEHIHGFSVMGGSIGGGFTAAVMGKVDSVERIGNYTPWAEFNIVIDPEAAASLFENPVLAAKTTLIPLDLTHLVLATAEVQHALLHGNDSEAGGRGKTDLRVMLVELLNFFATTYRETFGIVEGPPLHDPLAVAVAFIGTEHEIPFYDFDPRATEGEKRQERFQVTVVTEGEQTGRTIAKLLEPGVAGMRIPRGLDMEHFWRVIEECCQRADKANSKVLGK
ncbi:Inosine/uridine-preferring nucleoside hydrolase domain-containing protein [Pseudomassariella vexata]|uniref:Inosine/uridine-preferring nucleoside hydrolase domain-containing protein n=1 Tax=Pseudomassariella vexata TaxID=1141098 RepID=A0A1Y2E2V4_9PEZI|nr:Inosine/uridine-preferring nucleoside hydrolase domain-containing protein [Pseudomassariella vexata]ORY65880.1 Inosine/uridine-preferring nucleoside hydrolase domain-containing protein [Pseudomassariella vexata]